MSKLCLSIQQPYAWLITRPDLTTPEQRAAALAAQELKDIENRNWPTKIRGSFYIHAGKKIDLTAYRDLIEGGFKLPPLEELQAMTGGIVGDAVITDCVTDHDSFWFFGQYGFVLAEQRALPLVPCRGQLQFFEVPAGVVLPPEYFT